MNGVDQTGGSNINPNITNSTIGIGADSSGSYKFTGYVSNLRVVKGTALYTSAFTPSTTALTAITNTSLLTCRSNRFIDNSTNNFTLTAGGTPRVQEFQTFNLPASYNAATYGGSSYFNGTNDYIYLGTNSALNLGTGNFTLEFTVYNNSFTNSSSVNQPNRSIFASGNSGWGSGAVGLVGGTGSGGLALKLGCYDYASNGDGIVADTGPQTLYRWYYY
jgi:hypothetical protein